MKRLKKPLWILLLVIGALVVCAVVFGVLNALIGGGKWTLGWSDYRYDDSGYSVGDGTVYARELTRIDLDWIDGEVKIVLCEDAFPSVSEKVDGEITESSRMRFRVSEDGRTLSVKYRAPSYFLGIGENKQKDLILRIPARMMPQLEELCVKTVSSRVTLDAIAFKRISLEGESGDVALTLHGDTETASVKSRGGDVVLYLEESSSVTLAYKTKSGGALLSDLPYTAADGACLFGKGEASVFVETDSGEMSVKKKK